MTCVSDHMKITWICKFCGAVNTTLNNTCTGCSTDYASRESTTNQILNNGVIFNNAVFAPQPTLDDMVQSVEALYSTKCIQESDTKEPKEPKESFGMRVFTWTASILMWVAILVIGSIFSFLAYIVITAITQL